MTGYLLTYKGGEWVAAPDLRSDSVVGYAAFTCPCGARVLLSRPVTAIADMWRCSCGRVYHLRVEVVVDQDSVPSE